MPKPKSKSELIEASQKNFQKLENLIDSLPENERLADFPEGTMNRNIRDVLAHIYHWQLLFLEWYKIGMSGEKPEMPSPGHTWKTTPELNLEIWKKYQSESLPKIRKKLNISHSILQELIEKHSDVDLFTKKKYRWTGSTSLGAYLISATSSHYDWGWKMIRKANR